MGRQHEAGGDERNHAAAWRHLHAVGALARHPFAERRRTCDGHGARSHRGAGTPAAERSQAAQAAIGKGAKGDAIPRPEPLDQRDERLDTGVVLGVDVDPELGPARQHSLEPRNPYPATAKRKAPPAVGREYVAGVGSLHLGDGQLGDRARAVGEIVEPRVVEGHEHAVAAQVRVGLEVAVPERDRGPEGLERVLGRLLGAAAMGDRERRRMVEEGVQSAAHALEDRRFRGVGGARGGLRISRRRLRCRS